MLYLDTLVEMLAANIWPLFLFLLALLVLRQIKEDVRPIFVNIVSGVAKNAQSNAPAYAIAIGFGLSACIAAFIDVFQSLDAVKLHALSWHQYAALWAKVLNPFVVSVLAYATQNKFKGGSAVASSTNPPIPTS